LPLILCILFAVCPAYCSTYFVATNGNDTTGDGSIGNPWKTIPKAVTMVVAGDTIYLRGGTHTYSTTINISKSGSSDARYYLFAYPGERPVLDFSAMSESGSNRGIKLSGSYWHIEGIDIYKAGDNGMNMTGSYNIIEFCRFYENSDTGLQLGGGAAYNDIINCDSYYNADSSLENADGFAPKLDVGTGNYFYGCRAWQNLDDGYDGYLRPSDGILTTYENCWAFKNGYLKSGAASGGDGNGFKMGGSDNKTLRHNVILINCLSFENAVKGFDQNNNKGSMTLYNCTGFNNGTYNYSIATSPLASGSTATVTNCVYFTGSIHLGSFVVQTTNSWQSPFVVTSADFVSIDPSAAYGPRNADGSLPDIDFMHLAAGSDLIDGGTDVGLPYEGSAPDLGAFEYISGGDTTAPTPNPMTFATAPHATSSTSIAMIASTATDDTSGVEYYFTCTAGGGHDSGWQSGTSYTDTGLTPSTSYTYTVKARDTSSNHNETTASSPASATTDADTTPPAAPTGLMASAGDSTVSLDWNDNGEGDLAGYNIYRSTTSGSGYSQINGSLVLNSDYTDNTVTNGTTYYYVVTAVDISSNESADSSEASATPQDTDAPSAPTGLTAIGDDQVVWLGWDDNSESDLEGYNVYRSTTSGSGYVKLNGTLLSSSDYNDIDVTNVTAYYYVVTAVDTSFNESVYSSEVSATPTVYGDFVINGVVDVNDLDYFMALWLEDDCELTAEIDLGGDCIINFYEFSAFANNWYISAFDVTAPAAPTGLRATAGDGTVSLDWDDNSEADLGGYHIYRSTISGSGYSQLNGSLLTTSDYTDNSVTNDTTYYYVVTAIDTSLNESADSSEASATPSLPVSSITIQENETGFCGVDGTIDSDNSGFTGDGFANTDNAIGNGVDYSVNILTAGTYTFTWTYANGSSDRPGDLIINSTTEVSGISFPGTGGWTTWTTVSAVNVSLTTGAKTVRLEATTSNGLANIDYMQVTGPNLEAAACP